MTKTTTKKTIKKETVKVPTKQQFTYNRDILAIQMRSFIESAFQEMEESKVYEIDAVVNSIIEDEVSYIKSCERNPKKMTDYELSSILVARNMDVISELYKDEPEGESEGEKSEDDNKFNQLLNNLKQAAFHAYMEVDFTDLTDMLNYRRADFDNIGSSEKSLEALYIKNTPGNFEVKEIQEYVYWAVQEAIERFEDVLTEDMLKNSPELVVGEYYNHSAGILCRVTPTGVEISYMPISSYGAENGRN